MERSGKHNKKTKRTKSLKIVCGVFFAGLLGALGVELFGVTATGRVAHAATEEAVFVPSEVPTPEFSVEAGFYEKGFELTLTAPEGTEVYYTLDGSEPVPEGASALSYIEPIPVELCDGRKGSSLPSATVVRAIAVTEDGTCSDIQTNTYFVAHKMTEWYEVPVISLVSDPVHLYSEETGIITNAQEKGREWERPAHFEYFLPEGTREISMNVGIRINGAYSRRFEMKSFRIYARSEYDTQKSFKYDFFSGGLIPAVEKNGEQKNIEKFKRLVLRGGGNESDAWEVTFFRDILAQSLMVGTSLDVQAYQPAARFYRTNGFSTLPKTAIIQYLRRI